MKFMRNPIVVSLLAVAAVGLVINSVRPYLRAKSRRVATAPARTPVSSAPTALEKPASTPANLVVSNEAVTQLEASPSRLDKDRLRALSMRWAPSTGSGQAQPLKDPFQIRAMAVHPVYPPAREVLCLSAVWRQTDSSLAVLNNRIYAAGDNVLRYTIKSIEPDRVWVQGPNGPEVVEFKSGQLVHTNAPQNPSALGARVGPPDHP